MVDQRIGNYRIVRKIGEGGMGVVYECVHEYIGRRAAVKVLHADFSRNPEMAVRFLNEARATNIVQHPGIVNIFEFDRLPDGSAYIVMDYLDGDSLTQRLARLGGRLELPYALFLAWQISEALAAAHAKGVIHRDLKPDNVMIVADPNDSAKEMAKILDFGIAKVAESQGLGPSTVKTQVGVPMGTPLYMAPEQWKGASEVEDKADVYSLGVIIYEMLAGQPPFIANSSSEVMALHILATPRQLREFNPGVPEDLAVMVHQMLAKVPQERPTMNLVARELRRMAGINVETSINMNVTPRSSMSLGSHETHGGTGRSGSSLVTSLSGIGVQNASTSQVGPLGAMGTNQQLSSVSMRQALPPGLTTGGTAITDPSGVQPGPKPPAWQKPALIGVVGACVVALGVLVTKLLPQKPPPPPPQNDTTAPTGPLLPPGMSWSEVASNTTQALQDVWGTGPTNLWAVGRGGTLLRYNGTAWAEVPSSAATSKVYLNAIWGSAADDVWVTGKEGTILHFDGNKWNEVPSGAKDSLKDVWGVNKTTAWSVGENGVILRWNGNDWSPVQSGTETELRGIWGSGPDDVWAVGGADASDGIILHWDGKKWGPHGKTEARLNALWGSAANDVWAVGGRPGPEGTVHRFDGTAWKQVYIPRVPWLNAIWGSGPRDIWVVGESGTLLHYNGSQWADANSGTTDSFKGVFGTGSNDVWTVGFKGVIRHWSGKTWAQVPAGTEQTLEHVFGSGPNDVWAVGKAGTIVHYADGKGWSVVPSNTNNDLHGITGTSASNMWVAGDKGTILRWTGKSWDPVPSGATGNLHAMFAVDANDMWTVGEKGAALHWDGKSWSTTPTSVDTTLYAVFGIDQKNVWAAGEQGVIVHWNGDLWSRASYTLTGPPRAIYSIYGAKADSIWASGAKGLLLFWNGKSWDSMTSGTLEDINCLFGNGPFDVWAVGSGGGILHYAGGQSWTKVVSPTKKTLSGLWGSRPGDMWAVGQFGLILH
jgi:serine/threonine protein kinase